MGDAFLDLVKLLFRLEGVLAVRISPTGGPCGCLTFWRLEPEERLEPDDALAPTSVLASLAMVSREMVTGVVVVAGLQRLLDLHERLFLPSLRP
jgi:hypothetical protein